MYVLNSLYGTKCSECQEYIASDDFVMKVNQKIYHANCFKCTICHKILEKGQKVMLQNGDLICEEEYGNKLTSHVLDTSIDECRSFEVDLGEDTLTNLKIEVEAKSEQDKEKDQSQSDHSDDEFNDDAFKKGRGKRPRTILTTTQRRILKHSFDLSSKPCRKVRETLALETGLNVRVVQVWFQNQRAKVKKIERRPDNKENRWRTASHSEWNSDADDNSSSYIQDFEMCNIPPQTNPDLFSRHVMKMDGTDSVASSLHEAPEEEKRFSCNTSLNWTKSESPLPNLKDYCVPPLAIPLNTFSVEMSSMTWNGIAFEQRFSPTKDLRLNTFSYQNTEQELADAHTDKYENIQNEQKIEIGSNNTNYIDKEMNVNPIFNLYTMQNSYFVTDGPDNDNFNH